MTRFNKKIIFIPALVALSVCVACAADTDGGGGDDADGNTGSGGASTGSGGATTGSGGAPPTGSGGAPITGSGGAPPTGSGGATTGPNPTLTPSNFATEGYGTSDPWSGYVFTGAWDGAVVNPPCGTTGPCFTGPNVCAAGSIPASDEAGAMIGFNVNQPSDSTTPETWTLSGSGVTIDLERAPTTTRVQIKAGGVDYCAPLADNVTVPWSSFKTECWGTTGTELPTGAEVTAIEVILPGSASGAQNFDFCVIDIKLAP